MTGVLNDRHIAPRPDVRQNGSHRLTRARFRLGSAIERGDNSARLLDVNYQTSLLPQSSEATLQGWKGLLSISELMPDYLARFETVNARDVMAFMVSDANNPSSILNCLRAARENARAVRGALTTEVWETMNQTWLEYNRLVKEGALEKDPGELFEWVKFRSHLSRGVTLGTMLQDESFHFQRIGTFLERADNTTRLFRHHLEAFAAPDETGRPSYYAWAALLRALSAFEAYRDIYSDSLSVHHIGELLLLRHDLPRSLHACIEELDLILAGLPGSTGRAAQRMAAELNARLRYTAIDEILDAGLHPWLSDFIGRINQLGQAVHHSYLEVV